MQYKQIAIDVYEHIRFSFTDIFTSIWGSITGMLLFLIGEPTYALYGIGVLMLFDIFTRLRANAINYGGWIAATISGKIKSRLLVEGLMSKLIAYFIILSIAQMSKYVVPIETANQAISSIIYAILFFVEVQSVLENLLDAAPKDSDNHKLLSLLLFKFRKETEKFIGKDTEEK